MPTPSERLCVLVCRRGARSVTSLPAPHLANHLDEDDPMWPTSLTRHPARWQVPPSTAEGFFFLKEGPINVRWRGVKATLLCLIVWHCVYTVFLLLLFLLWAVPFRGQEGRGEGSQPIACLYLTQSSAFLFTPRHAHFHHNRTSPRWSSRSINNLPPIHLVSLLFRCHVHIAQIWLDQEISSRKSNKISFHSVGMTAG